ncbi:hypothetical protein [Candidatus Poriferisodalis sp.]|uniref:hypothetical protein n=1 Tax=Candidatus Poriferisodalis sp. TaxID=3101277 RepID=UPI003B025631
MTAGRLWVLVAVVAVLSAGCFGGPSFDYYDDSLRGTDELPAVVRFGQRIGPEGDGCWPEDRERGGTVFCDLVSIGGLHWDSGDVHVTSTFGRPSAAIGVGAGFLCLLDGEGRPWCWEWSADVVPRRARAPHDETFRLVAVVDSWTKKVEGVPGFACGHTPDFLRVVCWSVGVDQPDYRQSNHRFVDGHEWALRTVFDDPPRFSAGRRGASGDGTFHAFTGRARPSVSDAPTVLVTETLR